MVAHVGDSRAVLARGGKGAQGYLYQVHYLLKSEMFYLRRLP